MSNMTKIFFLQTLLIFCHFSVGWGAPRESISSLLATVNGEPVTIFDVLTETADEEKRLAVMYDGKELAGAVMKLRRRAVDELIGRKLIYAEFKSR